MTSLRHAAHQAKKHKDFFQKLFGTMISPGWNFVTAAFVPLFKENDQLTVPCNNCKPYAILNESSISLEERTITDMAKWLKQLLQVETYPQEIIKNDYDLLLAAIIGYSSLKESHKLKLLIRGTDEYNASVEEALFMLTKKQLDAVKDLKSRMIIDGDFGTGKTYILKEKAKECARKNKGSKIIYLNLATAWTRIEDLQEQKTVPSSFMDKLAEYSFDKNEYPNIHVITLKDIASHFSHNGFSIDGELKGAHTLAHNQIISDFLKKNPCDYLFIDELANEHA